MRRVLLVVALLVGAAGPVVRVEAASVYAGESQVANAAVRVRGTDGVLYQVEVQISRHDVAYAREGDGLRMRLATCNEHGCFGPWYAVPVASSAIQFGDDHAVVRATFAGTAFDVRWTARRSKKEFAPTSPAPAADTRDGDVRVAVHRDTRSAPAVVRFAGLACRTSSSAIVNQTGAIVAPGSDDQEIEPAKLPRGFFPAGRRTPRCF